MSLPSVPAVKYSVIALALAALGAGYWVIGREPSPASAPKARAEQAPERRGDDPTYAEELKRLTALLQDAAYRMKEAENQRLRDRDQAGRELQSTVQKAVAQSQQEIERLNRSLREAQQALEQKIGAASAAPPDPRIKAEVDRLAGELAALRQRQAELATPGEKPAAPPADPGRPEANRVLAGETKAGPPEARPDDIAPGPTQLAPGMLEQLRQIPGLEKFADRLAAGAGPPAEDAGAGRREPKTAGGLAGAYVTLNPYVAGGGQSRAAPAARQPEPVSYAPRRYPFDVKLNGDGASAVIPVYTLPDAATLVNNSTMTPLVGRVPVRNSLRDPFRFKLITGATNLASNGHRIPGIANAVWTGYAVGVREQSCVRAYIDTVTFTFEDGRITTARKGKGNESETASVNDNLGYLTDRWGKPCIRGRYFNNAGSYLRDRGMAAFLDGLANAYAQAQVTTQRDYGGGLSSYISGNTYQYAFGKGVGNSAGEIADYVAERAEGAFDVIYVPPGIDVQIFIETQIAIDYDTDGRKLRYDYASEVAHEHAD